VLNDPYASDSIKVRAKAMIDREDVYRKLKQEQQDNDFVYQRQHVDAQQKVYDEAIRALPKDRLELMHKRAQIALEQAKLRNVPLEVATAEANLQKLKNEIVGFETVTEGGRTYQRRKPQAGQEPGAFARPAGLPDTPKDLTEAQTTLLGHYSKAALSLDQMRRIPNYDKILAEGLRDELAGRVPYANNSLVSEQYRAVRIAASNLITAHLRRTSGAVIGAEEMAKHMNDIIPRYGDDPMTTRNKREQQDAIVSGIYIGLGETGQQYAKRYDTDRRETRAKAQEKINAEMAGIPNATPGQIYTNPRTKRRRLLTLDGWEDLD